MDLIAHTGLGGQSHNELLCQASWFPRISSGSGMSTCATGFRGLVFRGLGFKGLGILGFRGLGL